MTVGWTRGVIRGGEFPPAPRTVIKVGGSLLTRPMWPDELRALLVDRAGPTAIVVGGGPVVDGLRAIDAASPRPAHVMHRLAVEAMAITARLVAEATALPLVAEPVWHEPAAVVLDAALWLAPPGRHDCLPVGWQVTSDSIAALVAAGGTAALVLVKSVPPSAAHDNLASLARAGWVDDHFPVAAASLERIAWAVPSGIIPTSSR